MPTFDDYLLSGSGGVEYRLDIEGCPRIFVTSEAMEGVDAVTGAYRTGGLLRSGLSLAESVDMPNATLAYSLGSATIEDTSATDPTKPWLRGASSVFSAVPRVVGYLTASVSAIAATWSVRDASVFEIGATYHCDTEAITVTARDIGAKTITVARAQLRTAIQAHFVEVPSVSGSVTAVCPILSAPIYRNRRVWLYGHGSSELGTSDAGTLIGLGMLAQSPKQNGQSWSLTLSPRTQALEQEVGPVAEELKPRGIYYAGSSGLSITIERHTGPLRSDPYDATALVVLHGFFETQEDFCAALTNALNTNATIVAWGTHVFEARPVDATWGLFVTSVSTARFVDVFIRSGVDGFSNGEVFDVDARGNVAIVPALVTTLNAAVVAGVGTCDSPGSTGAPRGGGYPYAVGPEGLREVPRVSAFSGGYLAVPFSGASAAITAFPKRRLYLESVISIDVGDILSVSDTREGSVSYDAVISAVDLVDRYIEIEDSDDSFTEVGRGATFQIVPRSSECTLKQVSDFGTATTLAGFITALITAAQEGANAGRAPFLIGSDFAPSLTLGAIVTAAANGRPWLLARDYRFAKRVKLSEVIKHEARLYGLFMCTDAEGRITFRPVTTRTQTDFLIDSGDVITEESPKLEMSDAIITGATILSGYDPQEDKHAGRTVEVTSVGATAMLRASKPLTVEPKSNPSGLPATSRELYDAVNPTIQLFSSQRGIVTVLVPVTHARRLCGDSCLVSVAQVPYDGQRSYDGGDGGLVAVRGTLIAKRWMLSEPCVTLTIMCDSLDVAGYSPTARVVSQTGAGAAWTMTMEAVHYGDGVIADAAHFATGMRVRVVEWDADSPIEVTGVVSSVAGNDIAVAFDATWTPGSSTWNLIFDETDTVGLTDVQKRFAAIANASPVIEYAGGATVAARLFAP